MSLYFWGKAALAQLAELLTRKEWVSSADALPHLVRKRIDGVRPALKKGATKTCTGPI